MSNKKFVAVETDISKFETRVDEIEAGTTYDMVMHAISDIKRALYNNEDIAAICAPQVGINLRLFVVKQAKSEKDRFKVFLNPMIISAEGMHLSRETNASFPGKQFIIPRKNKIHVAYQIANGEVTSESYVGAYAEVIQQMIEMLDGITLHDYALDLDDIGGPDAFDSASKQEQTQVLQMYLDNLRAQSSDAAAEIDSSEVLKNINTAIDFRTKVLTGEVTQVDDEGRVIDDEYIKEKAREKAKKYLDELKKADK